jgi:hypothetical protein
MMYQQQQQANEVFGFGMFVMALSLVLGMVKSLMPTAAGLPLLLQTMRKEEKVTVTCPLCGKVIEVGEYHTKTRTEALKRHLELEHRYGGGSSRYHLNPQILPSPDGKEPTLSLTREQITETVLRNLVQAGVLLQEETGRYHKTLEAYDNATLLKVLLHSHELKELREG